MESKEFISKDYSLKPKLKVVTHLVPNFNWWDEDGSGYE